MLSGFDVKVTQNGHIFTVSGKDAERLHAKLKSTPAACKMYTTSALENGSFTMEKSAIANNDSMPNKTASAG